ncbi:hypothetical protein CROQUDRAFT_672703 [Cronartium quercuum f. sp. fusiforme G11]|uniref:Polysaccharide lyase 14 domain-containing protein n=1 Tax=Cronartium quercuum f. sp. fusiforme G11 TaxID=708437 RepID=A0A9P6NGY6_9BASI|nr:hypothetical protein CROQUDRAFT_672703 [Cronartium quercuum f. sp. fusiforme G11]
MQVKYPKGSIDPDSRNSPIGGIGFYASPIDITIASNVSLYYSVYFPSNFDFVKGGKLPGLYGGSTKCSGGENSDDCFSTRLMFRPNGEGELYLYAPKGKQLPTLCQIPPLSDCNADYGYSIGRGSFNFTKGNWVNVRQDIWLNNDNQNDGGFNIWINDKIVLHSDQVFYRKSSESLNSSTPSVTTSTESSDQNDSSTNQSPGLNRLLQVRPDNSSFVSPTSLGLPHPMGNNFTQDYNLTQSTGGLVSITTIKTTQLNRRKAQTINQTLGTTNSNNNNNSIDSAKFLGIMSDTFFGGHDASWASPKDQYSYFNRFGLIIRQ